MIEVNALVKDFKAVRAVDNLSFSVKAGEIFGLLGENGAGKTTTLRMLATMLTPTAGTATLCGHNLSEGSAVRGCVGFLFGGDTGLYDRLTSRENIAYHGALNDLSTSEMNMRIDRLANALGFEEYLDRHASQLSKGNKQKVAFARAIIHNPPVMLFDEPTTGLDVTSIKDARSFIAQCRAEGKAIVLSSHQMNEVQELCDRVGIMHKGKMVDMGTPAALVEKYNLPSLEAVFEKLVEHT